MRYSTLALLPLAAASPFKVGTIHNDAAPVLSSTTAEEVVPNSYIVVLKKHVKDAKKHHEWVQSVHTKAQDERTELRKRSQFPITTDIFEGLKHTYDIVGGLTGYSGHFDDETLEQIRRHPDVSTLLSQPKTTRHGELQTQQPPNQLLAAQPHVHARTGVLRGCLRGFASRRPVDTQYDAIARDGGSSMLVPCMAEHKLTIARVIGRLHREGLDRPYHGRR